MPGWWILLIGCILGFVLGVAVSVFVLWSIASEPDRGKHDYRK
jgi:hypothetical protein